MENRAVQSKPSYPWRLLGVAVFFVWATAGLGYYTWTLRGEHQVAKGELKSAHEVQTKLDAALTRVSELTSSVDECKLAVAEEGDRCKKVETNLTAIQSNLNATRGELETLRKNREETEKELGAFKELTEKFQKMIDSGKLNVEIRKGRMSVKLPAGVLFDSGSAEFSRDGELALMEVAIILRQLENRRFMVAGHTDNRPLENASETSRFRNNWELSTARAVTVTEFLIEAKMAPENLVAAGYGPYDPIGDNDKPAGRQENRRIEIVLLPNIESLDTGEPQAPPPG